MTPPRVSVVMPLFNAERYLESALESVLADGYPSFEVIAVDDGSTDRTPEILRRWAEKDARVVVVRQENRGIAEALNSGLRVARGEYIGRLDGDDLHVDRLRRQVEVLDRELDVVLVSTWFELIDEHGSALGTYRVSEVPEVTSWLLNFYNVIGGHAQVMFRRQAVLDVGGYRSAYAIAEDYDLWTRLSQRGRIVVLPFVGLLRRRHASAASQVERPRQQRSSYNVMRRTLSAYLSRSISDEEAAAVATLWRGAFEDVRLGLAAQICKDVYHRFATTHRSRRLRWRVRLLTGRRWCMLALRCMKRGRLIAALQCLRIGVMWHPVALPAAIEAVVQSASRTARMRRS